MFFKRNIPVDGKYLWTVHSQMKMRHYRLTESRVKRVIRHPARVEEGILENAVACMQPAEGKKYSEIWAMYVLARGDALSRHDSSVSLPAAKPGEILNARTARRLAKFPAEPHSFGPARDSLRKSEISAEGGPSKSRFSLSRKRIAAREGVGSKRIKVITAWRYPGKSPERDPVPQHILQEVRKILVS